MSECLGVRVLDSQGKEHKSQMVGTNGRHSGSTPALCILRAAIVGVRESSVGEEKLRPSLGEWVEDEQVHGEGMCHADPSPVVLQKLCWGRTVPLTIPNANRQNWVRFWFPARPLSLSLHRLGRPLRECFYTGSLSLKRSQPFVARLGNIKASQAAGGKECAHIMLNTSYGASPSYTGLKSPAFPSSFVHHTDGWQRANIIALWFPVWRRCALTLVPTGTSYQWAQWVGPL